MVKTKYTFLLPAYKGRFLDEMLRSIQEQTFKDFKVIISDDCSPEDLHSICMPYLSDFRFSYRRNNENMGGKSLVSHWNMLVNMCDTDYLILASDDDVYEPNYLYEIDKLTKMYPKVNLIRGRMRVCNNTMNEIKLDRHFVEKVSHIEYIENHFNTGMCKCMANFTFKTNALKKAGGVIDMPLAWFSDEMTTLLLAQNGCANTEKVIFNFRMSELNISSIKTNPQIAKKKALATLKAERWLDNYLKDLSLKYRNEGKRICLLREKACMIWGGLIYQWLNNMNWGDLLMIIPHLLFRRYWDKTLVKQVLWNQLKRSIA